MTVQVFSPQISVILRQNIGRATVAGTIAASLCRRAPQGSAVRPLATSPSFCPSSNGDSLAGQGGSNDTC
jgi:hypothetical protein